ncbi:hypothetical protein D1BOALGB6SA_7556 [Olavius sp. associated proteobacterium Delta 1]|nr:hypothetical protein D1BOALGB6SA_7556 [Olavius sp. associated proteobacterium Delta 1]
MESLFAGRKSLSFSALILMINIIIRTNFEIKIRNSLKNV